MGIYIVFLVVLFVLSFLQKGKYITRKTFCVLISLLLILITGLRHNIVGADTTVYYLDFHSIGDVSLSSYLSSKGEPLFYIVFWLVNRITGSFEIMCLLTACVFYIPIGRMIYKYCEDCCLGYLILLAFNFFQFSMSGMRQTMAMGLVCLAVMNLIDKPSKWFRFLVYLLLAYGFHKSSIIALLYIPIWLFSKRKTNNNSLFFSSVLIPVVFFFRKSIVTYAIGLYGSDKYTVESISSDGGYTTYILYILLFVVAAISSKNYFRKYESSRFDILVLVVSTALMGLVTVEAIFFRAAWYFSLLTVLIIPRLIESFPVLDKNRIIVNVIVYSLLLYMYVFITIGSGSVVPYKFFWN